jgi:hypothetical protein
MRTRSTERPVEDNDGEASDHWRASMLAASAAPVLPECMVR